MRKNNWSYMFLVLCGVQSICWMQPWLIANTLYNHEIEDCATMHTGLKWWLHGKLSYWHFSALKCLALQPTQYSVCLSKGNFALCCYNQNCPLMHRQQGLKPKPAALQVKLLSKSRFIAEWILNIQELGSHMGTWRRGVSQPGVSWIYPVTGLLFSPDVSNLTFFLSFTLSENSK